MYVLPGAGQRSSLDRSRRGAMRRLATASIAVAAIFAVGTPAHAALSAVGAINPVTKFPTFYQDAAGLQLAPCPAGTANCLLAPANPPVPSTYAAFDARFL